MAKRPAGIKDIADKAMDAITGTKHYTRRRKDDKARQADLALQDAYMKRLLRKPGVGAGTKRPPVKSKIDTVEAAFMKAKRGTTGHKGKKDKY